MRSFSGALTVRQSQMLDRWAITRIGIPSLSLMENAGRGVAMEAAAYLKRRNKSRIVIVCGTGNNGGDGLVAARFISNMGFNPQVYLAGSVAQLKPDALANYNILKRLKIGVRPMHGPEALFQKSIRSADVILDALFGVGLNRPLREPYYGIIEALNAAKSYVIAVDIPSGLDGTAGKVFGICVKADLTVTFSCPKKGFFKNEGRFVTGCVKVIDIGIPLRK
ncbi:MAG: NAD(P)H-hydrate epimerase [Candidatus Omnitrophica bacterium]|nr:NAD(P)H-hydrate epimerase [Candidatus Omnitrophota bacterium]MDE2222532.1 NAD(P)H-hydrate epimerase [Candidatus Omnitrophota bacterium]